MMKFQYQMKILLFVIGTRALCSCSQWVQQTEGYGPLTPEFWCWKKDLVFNERSNHQEYRNLSNDMPYREYVNRPLKLREKLHVRYYQNIINPESYELYGNDIKECMQSQGSWDQKTWERGGHLPVVPKGYLVVIHCVRGYYQYSIDKETGRIKNASNDVTALVEFFDPWTHRIVYGEYAWTSLEGIKKESGFVLHQYMKRAPWEPLSVPRLRSIQGPGYLTPEK